LGDIYFEDFEEGSKYLAESDLMSYEDYLKENGKHLGI